MNRFATLSACALLFALTPACGDSSVDAEGFVEGARQTTSGGGLVVTLWSDDGTVEPGMNGFVLHVAMRDPDDLDGAGFGVPGAELDVHAYMPNDGVHMSSTPTVRYLGSGEYAVDGLFLEKSGVWVLEFELRLGETFDELIEYPFEL